MGGHRGARLLSAAFVAAAGFVIAVPPAEVEAATFAVNDTRDRVDARPGNGVCRTSQGTCTLRAAVQEANARAGADVVTLRAGTYVITRAPFNENDITTGDLDVTGPLTLNGAGAATTVIDGGTSPAGADASRTALDRLFEVHAGAGDVTLTALTVREGWEAKEGGAIASRTTGVLRLVDVVARDSFAGTGGGGIHVDGSAGGSLVLDRSVVSGNTTGGEGGGIHLASGRLAVTGSTISGNDARNGGGVFNAGLPNGAGQSARVQVTGAVITGNVALQSGGGIDNRLEGVLELTDTTISNNAATGDGGGVAGSSKSSVDVVRTTFSANATEGSGGGLYSRTEGDVSIEASTFTGNSSGSLTVPDLAGDGGGGLAVYGSGAVNVSASSFLGNISSGDGGGIAVHSDGPVGLTDLVVGDNQSASSGGGVLASGRVVDVTGLVVRGNSAAEQGGGIDNQGSGEFSIVDTWVSANQAADGGGFSNRADSTLRVAGSTFSGNRATVTGGGFLHASDAATEIENTTLSGNRAGFNGGGLYLDADAGLVVANATITANTAPYGSGVGTADAIDNFPVVSHPLLQFRNTIVAGNLGGPDCHAAFGSAGGNLDGGTLCNFSEPSDRAGVDPQLEPLADNGGATPTHALTAFSAAVGGGVDPCPLADQRGVTREPDRPCDAGAVEFAGTPDAPPPGGGAPDTRLDSGPADTTESTEATFAFSSSSSSAVTFECALDGAPFAACSSPVGLLGLAVGTHRFEVRAVDIAGVVDPTAASYSWAVEAPPDSTPPDTSINGGPPALTDSRNATFTFSAEPDATFECSLDGVSFTACTSPAEYLGLRDGPHTFTVRASDAAGNQDPTAATAAWVVAPPPDITPPLTSIGAAPPALTEVVDATFEFSADEPGSTFVCAVDSTSFNACTSPLQLSGLTVGAHTFAVRATDPAGNVEVAPATHAWTVLAPRDTAPPETHLASAPASPTTATNAQFTFSSSESGSTFECALDGSAFAACSSSVSYSALAAGDHTFDVRAVDPAGNVDPTPESYTWSIEGPPPPPAPIEVSVDAGPASPTTDSTARFTFSATRSGARFECALDGAALSACTSPATYASLAPGEHTFDVRAIDAAGNADAARYTWQIEAPPQCGAPVTLLASADAWIDQNSTGSNKGSDSVLKVQSKAPRDNFRALLQFPLPARAPAGCVVASATLSLYAGSSSPDRLLQVFQVTGAWTEAGVTWANQPSTTGAPVVAESGTGYQEWNVTALVQATLDGGVRDGFMIRDDEGGDGFEQQFHSREKERPPLLVITYAPTGP